MAEWTCTYCQEKNVANIDVCMTCIKSYLEGGDDVNKTDREGNTALHYARHVSVAYLLLQAGAEIRQNLNGEYPHILTHMKGSEKGEQSEPGAPSASQKKKPVVIKKMPPMAQPLGSYIINEKNHTIDVNHHGQPITLVNYLIRNGNLEFTNPKTNRSILLTGKTGQQVIQELLRNRLLI
jgi:ankyrin repeat protein